MYWLINFCLNNYYQFWLIFVKIQYVDLRYIGDIGYRKFLKLNLRLKFVRWK